MPGAKAGASAKRVLNKSAAQRVDEKVQTGTKYVVRGVLVLIGLAFMQVVLTEMFPETSLTMMVYNALVGGADLKGTPEQLYKMAVVHKEAGMLHEALGYYDAVIEQTRNSSLSTDQGLHAECLLNKGSLLLVKVAMSLHMDPLCRELDYNQAHDHVRVGYGVTGSDGNPVFESVQDDPLVLPEGQAPPYSRATPEELVDMSITALSKAVRLGLPSAKEGLSKAQMEVLTINLGVGVLTSQIVQRTTEAKLMEVVGHVLSSLEGLEMERSQHPAVMQLMDGLPKVMEDTEHDRFQLLEAELRRGGFMKKLQGVERFLRAARRVHHPQDPSWDALTLRDSATNPSYQAVRSWMFEKFRDEDKDSRTHSRKRDDPKSDMKPRQDKHTDNYVKWFTSGTVFQSVRYAAPQQELVSSERKEEFVVASTRPLSEGVHLTHPINAKQYYAWKFADVARKLRNDAQREPPVLLHESLQ